LGSAAGAGAAMSPKAMRSPGGAGGGFPSLVLYSCVCCSFSFPMASVMIRLYQIDQHMLSLFFTISDISRENFNGSVWREHDTLSEVT
jgi:hypothetical protein